MSNKKQYRLKACDIPLDDSWDVIVAGGGPAGCAAATAAARDGTKTLLIERTSALGGMGAMGLVPAFFGFFDGEKMIARGLAEKVFEKCRKNSLHFKKSLETNPLSRPPVDPELLKRIYDDMVCEASAEILFNTQVCKVEKQLDNEISSIIVANKNGLKAFQAKVYVDCTGDGDLAAWSGVEFVMGDETGELQPATHCFMIGNVDDYNLLNGTTIHFFDPNSPVHKAIASDKYPLINDLHSCSHYIHSGLYGFNTGHIYNVNNTDSESVSKALIQGRKMADQYQRAFAEFHPAFANSHLIATGSLMGVRETRRIIGDYVLNIDDYLARGSFDDEICRNAYEIDIHADKKTSEESTRKSIDEIKTTITKKIKAYEKGESFGVPYRCLTPKGIDNLLVAGRCISTDRKVNGSIRIMPCCLTTGEAAGVAASMAAGESDNNVHNVDTKKLRANLKKHGSFLPDSTHGAGK